MRADTQYRTELARLRRATKSAQARFRNAAAFVVCCICNAMPAPMTRFGPRCEKHAPKAEVR